MLANAAARRQSGKCAISPATTLVVTDLDGTLLDRDTYRFDAARPALAELKRLGIPMVLCSSKTRAEMEYWRLELGNHGPFIVENGGALYVPHGCGYRTVEFGTRYVRLVAELRSAARATGCRVSGFSDWTCAEVAEVCGMSEAEAAMAKARRFSEPFLPDPATLGRLPVLLAEIERRGLRWTRGGRFHHITGANDKAAAIRELRTIWPHPVSIVALGDAMNDREMLAEADRAVIVRSGDAHELSRAVPHAQVTALPGAAGWNEAVLRLTRRF